MKAASHGGIAEARTNLLLCIGCSGKQGDVAEKVGPTQHTVRQVFNDLVQDGDRIKVRTAARWRSRLGEDGFDRLDSALRQVIALSEPSALPRMPQGGKKD